MALDLVLTDKDGATSSETLNRNGIQVEVKVVLTREALIAKITDQNKLLAQSNAKVTIDVLITGRNEKMITNAGAFARNLQGVYVVGPLSKVIDAPPGTVLDARIYTRALTVDLAGKILDAAMRGQHLNCHHDIGNILDHLGDVAKHFALSMNVMKMKIKCSAENSYMNEDQCKMFCDTVLRVNAGWSHHPTLSPNATSEEDA